LLHCYHYLHITNMMGFYTLLFQIILACTLVSARKCQNITIPVQISARNGAFNVAVPHSIIEVTDFALDFGRQGYNYTQSVLQDYTTVTGSYQISATHCMPENGPGSVLQILTHGIGFDKSYWDLPFKNWNYSYVATAVDQYGYSTLAWDRLGIANSSHGDPLAEIQAPLTQAALAAFTQRARQHHLPGFSDHTFSKIVHVGHSFGAVISYALARDDPSATDVLILQGWAMNKMFFPFFVFGGNLIPVTDLTSTYEAGYFAVGNQAALHTNFLAPGQYDPDMVAYAYANGHPASMGELLTIGGAMYGVSDFSGPVMVVTGERDLPFCGGDCYATGDSSIHSIPDAARQFFPKAKDVNITIVPGGGHGLNMEYGHETTYRAMNDFLGTVGIGANSGRRGTADEDANL
jgi:pimeloyl-ACP methyl ester carboxylesterase